MKISIIFFLIYLHTNFMYTFGCFNLCAPILKKDGREIRSVCWLDTAIRINGYLNLKNKSSTEKELIDRIINGLNNYKNLTTYEKQHMKSRQGLKHLNPQYRNAKDSNFFSFLEESIELLEQNSVPQFELNAQGTGIYSFDDFIIRIKAYSSSLEIDFKKYFDFFQDDGIRLYEQKLAKFHRIYTSNNSYKIHFSVYYPSSLSLDTTYKDCQSTKTLPLFYTENISGQPNIASQPKKKRFH